MENASKALIIAGAILIAILLITIGIVLVNSGKDITETGATQVASQNIQAFNSQFTQYEGTIKGSQVKSLIEQVRANNVNDKAHQVYVFLDSNIVDTEHQARLEDISLSQVILNSKKYNVEFFYSKNQSEDIRILLSLYADCSVGMADAVEILQMAGNYITTDEGYIFAALIY